MSLHKAQKLAKSATDAATWRGHTLASWTWTFTDNVPLDQGRTLGDSECTVCGRWVQVDTQPPANGIDIGGSAVAKNCKQ